MPKVKNISQVDQEIVVSKKSEERRTVSLKPGEEKNLPINKDDPYMHAAIFASAILVEGEEPEAAAEVNPASSGIRTSGGTARK